MLLIPEEKVQSASSRKLGDDRQAPRTPKEGKEIQEMQQASMWHRENTAPFTEVSFQAAAANSARKQEAAMAVAEETEKEKREEPNLKMEHLQTEPSQPLPASQADGKDTSAGEVAELGEKQTPQQGVVGTAQSGEAPLPAARQEAAVANVEAIEKERREEPNLKTEHLQTEPSQPLPASQADGKDTSAGKVAELGEKQAPQQGVVGTAQSGEAPLPAARQEAAVADVEAIEKEKREEPNLKTEHLQTEPSQPLPASQADGKDTSAGKVAELGEKQAPQQGVVGTAQSGEAPLPEARQEAAVANVEAIEKERREEPNLKMEHLQTEPSQPLPASQADGKDTSAGKVAELGEKQAPQQGVVGTAQSGEAPLPAARQEAAVADVEAIEKEKREEPNLKTEHLQTEPSQPLAASQADGKDTSAGKVAELGEKQAPQQGVVGTAQSGEAPLPAARQEAAVADVEAIEKEKREEPNLKTEHLQTEPSQPLAASQADGKDTSAGKVAELGEKQAPQQGVVGTAQSGEAPLPAARQEAAVADVEAIEKEKREEPNLKTEHLQTEPSQPLPASQADGKDTSAGKVAELGEKQTPQQGVVGTAQSGEAPLPAPRENPPANLLKEEASLAGAEASEKELGSAVVVASAVQNFRQARRLRKGQNRAAGTGPPQTGAQG